MKMEGRITLTELQLIIRDSLYVALPDFYWVVAEISELKENYAGHCYLELIEKHPDEKNVRARIKAVIWNRRYSFLKSLFMNITGIPPSEGMKILVKAKVEYHEIYGLSLVISDLDPSYTAGEMALKRQAILKKLEEEGVFSMNKDLGFPVLPQRIAVISSRSAAGYTDFINHITGNSYGYVFYTALFDAVMQGPDMEESVISALDRIASTQELFDVVVLIRGGGAVSDLSWFDNYHVAYHITQFPLPVITGIGHDKDLSVTDLVAHTALKTPTAVADHLIECFEMAESHLRELSTGITELSGLIINNNRTKLAAGISRLVNYGKGFILNAVVIPETRKSRLKSAAINYRNNKQNIIENSQKRLTGITVRYCEILNKDIEGLEERLKILDPVNVLARGFTITSVNGKIIKSVNDVNNDNIIETRFSDGKITSRVSGKKE